MKRLQLSIVLAGILLVGFSFGNSMLTGILPQLSLMIPKKESKPLDKPKQKEKSKNNQKKNRVADPVTAVITASKTVSVNGGGNAAPGSMLDYVVLLSNVGSEDVTSVVFTDQLSSDLTLVTGSIKATPIAINDSYTSLGNVGINVDQNNGLLINDISPDNTAMTVTEVTNATTTDGGKITINADGSFDYTPKTGTSSTNDTYTYTLNTTSGTSTATVNFSIGNTIWFVNNSVVTNGDGSFESPFKNWSDFATANTGEAGKPKGNQLIFVYSGTYNGSATLLSGQIVLGQGSTASISAAGSFVTPAFSRVLPSTSGSRPTITSSGNTIILAPNNILRGFNMGDSDMDITGTTFGTLTASEMALTGNGGALNLTSGTLAATFSEISSINATAASGVISCSSVAGNLTSGSTTMSNPSQNGINILSSSTLSASFGATNITGSGAASLNITGGNSNTAALTFGTLDISPDAGIAAVTISSKGSLTTTGGTIITSNVTGMTLNGVDVSNKLTLNVVLNSYTANGTSKTIGLGISNTLGSFTLNGVGTTAGSGGTIQNVSGRGVQLINAASITLKNLNLTNANTADGTLTATDNSNANAAIFANGVSGLNINNIAVSGTTTQIGLSIRSSSNVIVTNSSFASCGSTGVDSEGGIVAMELSGTCSISGTSISNSGGRNAYIRNTGNTTLGLSVTNSSFNTALGASNFLFLGLNNTIGNLTFKTNTFSSPTTRALDINANNTVSLNVQIGGLGINDGNTITAKNVSPGSDGIYIQGSGSPTVNYNVIGNNVQASYNGNFPINIGGQGTGGQFMGRILNNTTDILSPISATSGMGIYVGAYGSVKHITEISGNTVNGAGNYGIQAEANNNNMAGASGSMDATITNNVVNMLNNGMSYAHYGLTANALAANSGSIITCANTGGNSSNNVVVATNFEASSNIFGVPASNAVIKIQGNYGSLPSAWTTPNPAGGTSAIDAGGGGTVTLSGAFSCLTPSNPAAARIMARHSEAQTDSVQVAVVIEKTDTVLTSKTSNSEEKQVLFTGQPESAPTSEKEEVNTMFQKSMAGNASGETIVVSGSGSGFRLPAGKSTTITFSTIISNAPSSCTISNQGTVSATSIADILTDDPNLGGVSDPTDIYVVVPGVTSSSISATSICSGGSVDLSAACASGSQINWFTQASGGSPVSNTSDYSPTNIITNTSYYASCTIAGCESQRTLVGSVSVNALPDASITATPDPICSGATVNLSVNDAGLGASYSWSGDGVVIADSRTTTATPSGSGSKSYSVTVTDGNSCSASSTASVTVNVTPQPSASSNSPVCVGNTLQFASSSADSYSWSGPNGFSSTDRNPSITDVTTQAEGTYTVTVTVSGCTSSAEVAVTVNASPTINTVGSGVFCEGSVVDLGASGGVSYSWSGPNSFNSTLQNPQILDFASINTGSYIVTVLDANNCMATSEVVLDYKPLPAVDLTYDAAICEGSTLYITASVTNATGGDIISYSWTGPDSYTGSSEYVNISPANTINSGEYILTTTLNGCEKTSTASVNVVAKPTAPSAETQHVCSGGNIAVSASCSSGSTVVWYSDADGTTATTNMLNGVNTDVVLYAGCESNSLPGCIGSLTPVQVVVDLPVSYNAQLSDFLNLYLCENGSGFITLNSALGGNNQNYQWQLSTGGSFSDLADNNNYSGVTRDTLFLNNIPVGFNNYKYRVLISNVCSSIIGDTTTLQINILPTIITQPTGQTVCTGNETVFSIVTGGTGVAYQWQVDLGAGFVNLSNSGNYSGVFTQELKVSGINGNMNNWKFRCLVFNSCQSTISDEAILVVDPTVTILTQPISKTICQNHSVSFNVVAANITNGALNFQWQRKVSGNWINLSNNSVFSGVNSSTLTITEAPYSLNQAQFRCLMNSYCQTSVVSLTINPVATITGQPQNQFICQGNNASFTINATGTNLTFRWQVNTGSGFVDVFDGGVYQGATAATLNLSYPPSSMNGYSYRCVVQGHGNCDQGVVNSQQAVLNIGVSAEANVIVAASPITGTSPTVYQAVQSVLGINSISSVSKVEYRAGNSILLNPGFSAEEGSVFVARIQNPCSMPDARGVNNELPKEIRK